jgi:hypothetical protein
MDRIGSVCSLDRGIVKSVYIYYKKDTKFGFACTYCDTYMRVTYSVKKDSFTVLGSVNIITMLSQSTYVAVK